MSRKRPSVHEGCGKHEAMSVSDPVSAFPAASESPQKTPQELPPAKAGRRLADLLPRLLSGVALMVLALGSLWLGGTIFVMTWLAAAVAVFWEWQTMIGGARKAVLVTIGCIALVVVAFFSREKGVEAASLCWALSACLLAALAVPGRRIWAGSGILYAGALIGSLCLLNSDQTYGPRVVIWLFAIVWGTDIFAYFGGRLMGGPKIWPKISPGKTWSGTLTGVACGAVLGTFFGVRGLIAPVSLGPVLGLSLAAASISQAGDMFESWMKRRFGVKDSSRLIPGHGGFMDRLDGFIAAAFFAALVAIWRGSPSLAAGLFIWS